MFQIPNPVDRGESGEGKSVSANGASTEHLKIEFLVALQFKLYVHLGFS